VEIPCSGTTSRPIREQRNLRSRIQVNWCRPTISPVLDAEVGEQCPRRESNPDLRFRKPPFYPLNYGDALSGKAYPSFCGWSIIVLIAV
jgi:hypothetical protein